MSQFEIPMRYIDLGKLLSPSGSSNLSLIPAIETWLADNGIACRVGNPWGMRGWFATFATAADASLFRLCWL